MQTFAKQPYKTNYTAWYCSEVTRLSEARATQVTQAQIAHIAGVSLRTVQRFEGMQTDNPYLLWLYGHLF
jgi:DNA-binding transcriptional regulator YiaG